MATKNHRRSMSQPERAFWREAFISHQFNGDWVLPIEERVKRRADYADLAVEEYRKRVTWRNQTGNVPPAEDNARLIAAAPELLAALRPVADLYEYEQTRGQFPRGQTWDTIPHNIGQAARAAIAKVEGQS